MKIKITEQQYKLILEQKEYFEQLKELIINDNLDLAIEASKSVNVNIEDVFIDLLIGDYHAYDGTNYNFNFSINDVDIMDLDEKKLVLNISNLNGNYFHYDGQSEYYIDINNLIEDDEFMSLDSMIEWTIIEEFNFLEDYDLSITFF